MGSERKALAKVPKGESSRHSSRRRGITGHMLLGVGFKVFPSFIHYDKKRNTAEMATSLEEKCKGKRFQRPGFPPLPPKQVAQAPGAVLY